jgi:hypothetical protein
MAAHAQPAHVPVAVAPASTQRKTNWVPTRKVGTGALAGAVTVLVMTFVGPYLKDGPGAANSASISAAITMILTFGIQYWVPENKRYNRK